MAAIHGYTIMETLRENDRFVIQRALRLWDRRSVILKRPSSEDPSPETLRLLKHEWDVTRTLAPHLVLRPLALERRAGSLILVVEDTRSVALSRLLGAPMSTGRFLRFAVQVTAALEELHEHGVIHKDIRPDNILVDAETGQSKFISFGIASLLPREHQTSRCPSLIEGSLAYMSPEQTGRMNRAVDHRADLYSLGITFYEMLTGSLPYRATDPLEWVHFHVACAPRPPEELAPCVPGPVSAIVLLLLSKVPEDRYQTARGLRHDLLDCLARWEATGRVEPFPLRRRDVPTRLWIPQKLYGRDRQLAALTESFERVVATGAPEFVLVSGYSGIGKSSLIHELHKPIVATQGLLLSGKFDRHKRDIPYSTMVQAFVEIIRQVLMGSGARLAALRRRLHEALGRNAQLLINLIPELELIIGPQPPVAPLPLTEEKGRFYRVFQQLLGAFAGAGRPLTLFLDDLQWADAGSLALLAHLFTDPGTQNLLLIGAYRDNEVPPAHPLSLALAEIRASGARVCSIVLAPLSLEDVNRLVADALHCEAEKALPLSALIEEKTRGNPFFVLQFLTTLYQRGLVAFDREERAWTWDLRRIEAEEYADNVVDLLVGRVNRLAPEARSAMMLAACAGHQVHIDTLAAVSRRSAEELHGELWEALREELMIRVGDTYRFMHDRVHQAAYLLIPDGERAAMHLSIGRALLAATRPEDLEERAFDLVNQLNRGSGLVVDPAERERLVELNLRAGRRAKASTAYASATGYLSAGIRLLGGSPWSAQHDLAYELHLELAASYYLDRDVERAARILDSLIERAQTRLQKAAIRRLEVELYTSLDELDEAIARGALGLSLFGLTVPSRPSWAEVEVEYQRVWRLLGDRAIEDLLDLPPREDPELCAAEGILAVLFAPALNTDRNLSLLVYCQMVNISLVHGSSDASALAYAYFGMSLGPVFGRYPEGYRFGKLGYDLMERRRSLAYRAKISFIFGDNTLYWTRHLKHSLAYLGVAFQTAVETGDVSFACYCCNHLVVDRLILGHPLDDVFEESERRLAFTRKARFDASTQTIIGIQRLIQGLRGRTPHLSSFSGADFVEEEYESVMDRHPWAIVTCWYYIMKLEARVLSGDFAEAAFAAARAGALLWSTVAHIQEPEFWYYGALALAGKGAGAGPEEQAALLASLRRHEQKLGEWARSCPENFGSKHALVAAELLRIEGRPLDAMPLYEQAARSARENGYVQNEALAHETAARFYQARGLETLATAHLREARRGYAAWGAEGKVAALERRYPHLSSPRVAQIAPAIMAPPEQFDLLAVLKASQAISREIVLSRLLSTLVRTVIQQAGAQRGFLLLTRGDELGIEAEARSDPSGIEVLLERRALSASAVPASIIDHVRRSGERVLLDDAARTHPFSADPYIEAHRPRSLLCLPILRQTELVGALYLENNLVAGAFTHESLTVASLLASQAAISLQNAMLFADLERAADERARLLGEAEEALEIRDEFLSIASHELLTPLTPLRLQMQLLQRHIKDPSFAAHPKAQGFYRLLDVSNHQIERLTRLVHDLLDVSRLRAGQLVLSLEDVDLTALLRDTAEGIAVEIGAAGSAIELREGEPVIGRCDRFRVEQVMVNLLANAMKYGGGAPISMGVQRRGSLAEIWVLDGGVGIPEEAQGRIFERFERAVSSRSFGGLGLGLYIARRIVEAHRGTIRVTSKPGEGAMFTVELPIGGPPDPA
jgi:predicted ATPase/signal transduction histidine kinase